MDEAAVWVAALRNGLAFHRIAAGSRFTECGRSMIAGGYVLQVTECEAAGMKPCGRCDPAMRDATRIGTISPRSPLWAGRRRARERLPKGPSGRAPGPVDPGRERSGDG